MKLPANRLLVALSALLIFSCSKKDSELTTTTSCRTVKTYMYDSGAIADSFLYVYNADNKVEKVTYGNGSFFVMEYEGSRIVRRNHFSSGDAQSSIHEIISYNTNGTIKQTERLNSAGNLLYKKVFTHTSNKLTMIEEFDGAGVLQARYKYTYTINNLTRLDAEEYWGGTSKTFRILYSFDNNPNFFQSGEQVLLTNGFFNSQFSVSIPYALSDNNVKELEYNGAKIPVTYTFDDNKNVTEVRIASSLLMKATYECR